MATEKQIETRKRNLEKGKNTRFSGKRAVELGKKGNTEMNRRRKERKTFQEVAKTVLSLAMRDGDVTDIDKAVSIEELNGKNLTVEEGIIIMQAVRALKGDRMAAEYMRDTAGEKPVEKQDINIRQIDQTVEEMEKYFDEKSDS